MWTGTIDDLCGMGVDLTACAVRVTTHWNDGLTATGRLHSSPADVGTAQSSCEAAGGA